MTTNPCPLFSQQKRRCVSQKILTFELDLRDAILDELNVDISVESAGQGVGKGASLNVSLPVLFRANITISRQVVYSGWINFVQKFE